jgi:hypothetical protein
MDLSSSWAKAEPALIAFALKVAGAIVIYIRRRTRQTPQKRSPAFAGHWSLACLWRSSSSFFFLYRETKQSTCHRLPAGARRSICRANEAQNVTPAAGLRSAGPPGD